MRRYSALPLKKLSHPYWRLIENRYSAQPAEKSVDAASAASLFESLVPKLSAGGRFLVENGLWNICDVCDICFSSRSSLEKPVRRTRFEAREWLKINLSNKFK